MPTPNDQYIALVKESGRVDLSKLDDIFNQLPSLNPEQLLGQWNGGFSDTGHPVADTLKEINWTGKSFRSFDDVDPVIVIQDGKRSSWGKWGMASLHKMVFRGALSTTMIYDDRPVLDHFRYVDENTVAGVMEGKALRKDGDFHFYLRR
ncbi:hypothetical protein BDW62DRAFT_175316 [Aspergillus aurantiobrunneus]